MIRSDSAQEAVNHDEEVKQTWGQAIRYIVGRKRAEEALGLIAAVGTALSSIPNEAAAIQAIANYIVPYLADWCQIDRFDADGTLTKIAEVQAAKLPMAVTSTLDQFFHRPDRVDGSSRIRRVWESRKSFLYPEAPQVPNASCCANGAGAKAASTGIGTAIIVPIEQGNQLLGAISCATVGVRKTGLYGPAELALLAEVAQRLGSAFVIAELTQTVAHLRREIASQGAAPIEATRRAME